MAAHFNVDDDNVDPLSLSRRLTNGRGTTNLTNENEPMEDDASWEMVDELSVVDYGLVSEEFPDALLAADQPQSPSSSSWTSRALTDDNFEVQPSSSNDNVNNNNNNNNVEATHSYSSEASPSLSDAALMYALPTIEDDANPYNSTVSALVEDDNANRTPASLPFLDVDWDAVASGVRSWTSKTAEELQVVLADVGDTLTTNAAIASTKLGDLAKSASTSFRTHLHKFVKALPPPESDLIVMKRDAAFLAVGLLGAAALGAVCHARHLGAQVRSRDVLIERLVADIYRERTTVRMSSSNICDIETVL